MCSPIDNSFMNKISEICIVSLRVSQAVYHNTNCIVTKCIVTPLFLDLAHYSPKIKVGDRDAPNRYLRDMRPFVSLPH